MRKFKLDDNAPDKAPDPSKYKDFGKVVTNYQRLATDIHRVPLYKDKRLFLFVLIAVLLLYLMMEAHEEEVPEPTPPETTVGYFIDDFALHWPE